MRLPFFLAGAAIALAVTAAPAVAQSRGGSASGWSGDHRDEWNGERHRDGDRRDHWRHHRRDGRDDSFFGGPWVDGDWARYNNQSWNSDSYNDWWHDRPDRAYPRWVQHNEGCEPDRMWWSGSGWHC